MSETRETNWLPWVAVAVLGYFAFVRQPAVNPVDPDNPNPPAPAPMQSINKTLDAAYKADRSDKLKTLKEFSEKQFSNDQEALEWFNKSSTERRIETFAPYTDRVGKAMFDGKVKELAAELESGR